MRCVYRHVGTFVHVYMCVVLLCVVCMIGHVVLTVHVCVLYGVHGVHIEMSYVYVLVRISIVMKHRGQAYIGRIGFVWHTLPHCGLSVEEVRTGTQTGRNVEAGAKAEAMVGHCAVY